ncbi:MAG TPA: glycosyltransferase family 39 protein [Candidatus Tumulicola sp.]|nr:glycosyltransferase family 39 protein [Candidatus Tumulicola sp.]
MTEGTELKLRGYGLWLWLAAALALGGALIFWRLTDSSLQVDEGFTLHVARIALPQMFNAITYGDFHPPLFYLIAHWLVAVLHWPAWDYRYLTAPFGLLTIAATWALVRRSFGDAAAICAALVVATEPLLVQTDRTFRMYAVLAALTTVSWLALVAATGSKPRPALWLGYALSAIALPYIHYLGGLVVVSQAVFALTRARTAWPALVASALALLAFLPWAPAMLQQFPVGGLAGSYGGAQFDWSALARETVAAGLPAGLRTPALDWAITVAVIAVIGAGTWLGRRTFLPYWLAPALMQIVFSFAFGKTLALPRYLTYLLPAFAACIGVAFGYLIRTKARVLAAAAVLSIVGVSLLCDIDLLAVSYYKPSDWYAVDLLVRKDIAPTDVVVFDQGLPYAVLDEFATFREHEHYLVVAPDPPAGAVKWLDARRLARVWYVENAAFYPDPEHVVRRRLSVTRRMLGMWVQSHVNPADDVLVILYGPRR